MQYTSFVKDLPSFAEESPSFTEELPSFTEKLPSFLTTPVQPVQQQEEEAAATVCDSCNLGTFLYNIQCINISVSRIFLISEYRRPVLEESLSCWLLRKHYDKYFMYDFMYTFRSVW
jgi:hypothetical protein